MRFLLLAVIATLTLAFSGCDRRPDPATTTSQVKENNINLDEIEDFGAEAIRLVEERVAITDEQKAKILEISKEYDFAGADTAGRKKMGRELVVRIKKEVLTKEQLRKGSGRN